MKKIDSKTSKKISIMMFLCCVCVVFYHGVDYNKYNLSNNFVDYLAKLLIDIWYPLCQSFAMPFFLMCSGALFYKNISDYRNIGMEIKKRIRSVLIPFLIWNLLWTIFSMFISKIPTIRNQINGLEVFNWSIVDFIEGVLFYKFNGVMWYLQYIFIYSLASPIIYTILKNKKTGIFFILFVFIVSSLERKLFDSYNIFWPFLFYIIGAFIMIQKYSWINKHFKLSTSICYSTIFIFIIIFSSKWRPEDFVLENILYLLTRIFGATSLWIGLDYFIKDNTKIKKYMNYYFFIYLFHFIPGLCINKIFELLLPNNWAGLLLNKYLGGLFVILLCIILCWLLEKFLPNVYSILVGNRKNKN